MNFPMDNPVYSAIYWLLNTPGLGGIAFALLVTIVLATCTRALIWIAAATHHAETAVYPYPTPALHENEG